MVDSGICVLDKVFTTSYAPFCVSLTMRSVSQPSTANVRVGFRGRLKNFWQRVSEGREIADLWKQFAADARAGYGFYGRDVDWEKIHKVPRWRRPIHVGKQFFWVLLVKLTPVRRVLLLMAVILLVLTRYELFGGVLLFVLLLFELADKVTMKRDLEIAREIQSWLVPAHPPEVPGAEIAFTTRAQNSVAGDYYDAFFPNPDEPESKLMVVIADVVGKSIPAALLMATLQASLRTMAGEGGAPGGPRGAPQSLCVRAQSRWPALYDRGSFRIRSADAAS